MALIRVLPNSRWALVSVSIITRSLPFFSSAIIFPSAMIGEEMVLWRDSFHFNLPVANSTHMCHSPPVR